MSGQHTSDIAPTRSAVIALKDERRTMREGYAFLDEKCLLLAAAMLREMRTASNGCIGSTAAPCGRGALGASHSVARARRSPGRFA
jgi:hypothetical protein